MNLKIEDVIIKEVQLVDTAELIFRMDLAIFTKPRVHLAARTIDDIYDFLKDCTIYFAYSGDEAVGYIGCLTDKSQKVEITGMGVMPAHQGKGVGTKLLRFVLKKFSDNTLYLVAHPENDQALRVYKKVGFNITGRKENYYGDGEPRAVLELKRKK